MRRFLLGKPSTALRESYIWYSIGGMLNAGQSALILMVISYTNSAEDAGIFSIAYAIACLTLTIGNYGMRNFQATDVREKYKYSIYVNSRIITVTVMMLLIVYYILKGFFELDYSREKCLVILFVGLMKIVDAIEDVVHGRLQQKGRLDIGARCMASRYILVLCTLSIMLLFTHNLLFALEITFIVSLGYFMLTLFMIWACLEDKITIHIADRKIYMLLKENFGLFIGSFTMLYIANAPKYAIDKYMDDTMQACYNYIFMPVYVVSVLNTFIYQPILTKLADICERKELKEFNSVFFKQLLLILSLGSGILIVCFFIGIPILSIFYNINLSDYKIQLLLLILGSIFLAVLGYLGVVITILRKQNWLILGYLVAAIMAHILAEPLVLSWGITGATVSYTGIVFLLMIIFALIFIKSKRVILGRGEYESKFL